MTDTDDHAADEFAECDVPSDPRSDKPACERVLDHLCANKDNYRVDRELVELLDRDVPGLRPAVRSGRVFLARAVTTALARTPIERVVSVGLRFPIGFCDHDQIHRKPPHEVDLHRLVGTIRPEAETLYLDSSPLLLSHARALLEGPGVTIATADPTAPAPVSAAIEAFADGSAPLLVCLELLVLERIPDPRHYLRTVLETLPPGSYLLFTHLSAAPDTATTIEKTFVTAGLALRVRTRDEIAELLHGTDPLPPGLTHPHQWHPPEDPWAQDEHDRGWAPAPSDPSLLYAAVTTTKQP
ncbi:SAM-dependent methyltransferase [Nocardia takedensis]|uniref:SAM-dependent methyltransferase n=1 Tax=Nocardia takedensis TaxID=259390 RepID=UPI0002E2F2ED|nr:SAM-dependent methyltransferase [Nocardia takedensis]